MHHLEHTHQKLIYVSESSKSNGTLLGKRSMVLVYHPAVPCLVTRTGYAGASSQQSLEPPVSFQVQRNFSCFVKRISALSPHQSLSNFVSSTTFWGLEALGSPALL